MIGIYKNKLYKINISEESVSIITYKEEKKLEGFLPKRDYYILKTSIHNENITDLYEINYFVKYKDNTEKQEKWLINEFTTMDFLQNNEIVIHVNHFAKDDTWKNYDKCAATKVINLENCEEYIINKRYIKKNGVLMQKEEEISVSLDEFVKTMISHLEKHI